MALIIDVSIELGVDRPSIRPGGRCEARFWIDSQSERGLNSEIEVPLTRGEDDRWTGTVAIQDKASQFLYRLGLLARPGAVWSLSIRNRTLGYTFLTDTDELGAGKAWLTGLCPLPRANAKRKCIGGDPAQEQPPLIMRRRTPYLLLLDR